MPDLTTLLRDAVLPADVPDLRRLHERRRALRVRRRAVVTIAAVAAIGGVLASMGTEGATVDQLDPDRGSTTTSTVVSPATTSIDLGAPGMGVAAADGVLWVATRETAERTWAVERVPVEGGERRVTEVPGTVQRVAVGLGHVWAYGGGDGAAPDGGVAVLDPATAEVVATTGWHRGWTPHDVAFGFGSAWVANGQGGVLRLDLVGGEVHVEPIAIAERAAHVLVTTSGVWAHVSSQELVRIDPATNEEAERVPWTGYRSTTSDGDRVWTTDGIEVSELRLDRPTNDPLPDVRARFRLRHGSGHVAAMVAGPEGLVVVREEGIGVYRFGSYELVAERPGPTGAGYWGSVGDDAFWFTDSQRPGLLRWPLP